MRRGEQTLLLLVLASLDDALADAVAVLVVLPVTTAAEAIKFPPRTTRGNDKIPTTKQ